MACKVKKYLLTGSLQKKFIDPLFTGQPAIYQQITIDHVQETTNLSAEDEMVNNNSPYSSETWNVTEEPDRENYMAGQCMIQEICAILRACC